MFFLKSTKDKQILCDEDYIYHFKKQNKPTKLWIFRQRNCLGRVKTDENGIIVNQVEHNHSDDSELIETLRLKQEIKENALNTTYSARELYRKHVVEVNKDINILRGSLYKNINTVRMKLNYKLDVGTEIPCHLAYTYKKEEFLLY
jgi:hypothetical protein